jgi:hypothetical protein
MGIAMPGILSSAFRNYGIEIATHSFIPARSLFDRQEVVPKFTGMKKV